MAVRGILLRMSSGCARREGEMESIRPTTKSNKSFLGVLFAGGILICLSTICCIGFIVAPIPLVSTATPEVQLPIEEIIAMTFNASQAQTLAVASPLPTQTISQATLSPSQTPLVGITQPIHTALPVFETNTPLLFFTFVPATAAGAVCACAGDTLNCKDFQTHQDAQDCFDYCVAQGTGDIHMLDENNNGDACEDLP